MAACVDQGMGNPCQSAYPPAVLRPNSRFHNQGRARALEMSSVGRHRRVEQWSRFTLALLFMLLLSELCARSHLTAADEGMFPIKTVVAPLRLIAGRYDDDYALRYRKCQHATESSARAHIRSNLALTWKSTNHAGTTSACKCRKVNIDSPQFPHSSYGSAR
jgi:hypothetical protein